MHNEFWFFEMQKLDHGLGLRLAGGSRAGVIARGFGLWTPVFRGEIAIQVHAIFIGAAMAKVSIDIQARNQKPGVQNFFREGFFGFLQPTQELQGQSHPFGFITMNSANKQDGGCGFSITVVCFFIQLQRSAARASGPRSLMKNFFLHMIIKPDF